MYFIPRKLNEEFILCEYTDEKLMERVTAWKAVCEEIVNRKPVNRVTLPDFVYIVSINSKPYLYCETAKIAFSEKIRLAQALAEKEVELDHYGAPIKVRSVTENKTEIVRECDFVIYKYEPVLYTLTVNKIRHA